MKPTEKVAAVIIIAFVAVVVAVALAPTIRAAPQQTCANNLKILSLAISAYCEDAERLMPPAGNWAQALVPRYLEMPGAAICPAAKPTAQQAAAYEGRGRRLPVGYAIFQPLAGRDARTIREPEKLPMVFDANVYGPDAAADLSAFDARRHPDGGLLAYADGHIGPLKAAPQLPAKPFMTLKEAEAAATKGATESSCSE